MLNELFPHYFEQAGDPGDAEELGKISIEAGVFQTPDEASAFFAGKEFEPEVQAGFESARVKEITGVPHFEIVAGHGGGFAEVAQSKQQVKAEIPGAQEPETLETVFKQIAQAYEKANGTQAISGAVPSGAKC